MPELKIALCTSGFAGEAIDPQCAAAAIQAAKLCETLGCKIEHIKPDIDGHALREALKVLFAGNIDLLVRSIDSANPDRAIDDLVEPISLAASHAGRNIDAARYVQAIAVIQSIARQLGAVFERYDVLLTPTLANPPLPLGELSMAGSDWDAYITRMLDEIAFTPLYNATGAPAASVPLGRSREGWPIGVQIGAALGREDTLLQLARALELAAPWHTRR